MTLASRRIDCIMGIFRKIIDGFIPQLTQEQEQLVRSTERDFNIVLDSFCDHYVTKREVASLEESWKVNYTNIKKLRIRQSDPLYSVAQNFLQKYEQLREEARTQNTVHRSKGLEADNVVLLFQGGKLGFPNKIADDPLLELVLTEEEDFLYAEERRLLYVALTRTKNRTFVIASESHPSEFMKDFDSYRRNDRKSVFFLSSQKTEVNPVMCPRCKTGRLSIRRQESRNRYFVGCSNFPQCGFTVNDTCVVDAPVYCPECGGFMVRRKGKQYKEEQKISDKQLAYRKFF